MGDFNTRQTLIEKLQHHQDENSWEDFNKAYAPYLYVVIRNMSVGHHDAEDLRQQVLLRAWKGLPKFTYEPGKHRFRSWLCTITRNAVNSHFSKVGNKVNSSAQQLPDVNERTLPQLVSEAEVETLAEKEWDIYIANLAYEKVSERFHERVMKCFDLFMEEIPAAEVAKTMGITLNSAYVNNKRVQNALYKEILRLDQELG